MRHLGIQENSQVKEQNKIECGNEMIGERGNHFPTTFSYFLLTC